MDDLNDLVFFAKVVEFNGFSAASRQLGIPKSRLSRRISLLEERMGVRLLHRTSRQLVVTPTGQLFYERCQAVVSLSESARDVIQQAVAEPKGPLRISCPITLAQCWLNQVLAEFLLAYPKVRVSMLVTNRRVDPVDEHMDLVLRVRRQPFEDSSLVVRRLGQTTDLLVASPAFLVDRGEPREPQELSGWPTLSLPSNGDRHVWTLRNDGTVAEVAHEPRLVTEDMFALKQAAMDGVGVSLLAEVVCRDEIKRGLLKVVLPQWRCPISEIQAAFPTRRGMLPAVRALIEFMAAHPLAP